MTDTPTISRFKAYELAKGSKGKFFTVRFVKRSDGSVREMNCRIGVKKGVKGKGLSYDPIAKGVMTVYDVHKKGFRMINLETLLSIKIDGKTYNVEPMSMVPVNRG